MRRYVREGRKRENAAHAKLFSELDTLQSKLQNQRLKDKYRTKKHILRALSTNRFKKPYTAKWWQEHKEQELEWYIKRNNNFCCPKCNIKVAKPTLQHIWHPKPFRVLCTEGVSDKEFVSSIPKYIEIQNKKKGLNAAAYKRWCWWDRKGSPSYSDEEVTAFGYCKARSNYALGYFSSDELLLQHIGEIRRHIELHREDYKYVCGACAFDEDKNIIKTGRLVTDVPYFLFDEECSRRDILAQALIEEFVDSL